MIRKERKIHIIFFAFFFGMIIGGAIALVLYALLIANDEDSARGHP